MKKIWADTAWEDYLYWQSKDKNKLEKINKLIKEIDRHPFEGTGKPEPLKHNWKGYWSRRIDNYNRLVYRIENGSIEIAQCKSHYDE